MDENKTKHFTKEFLDYLEFNLSKQNLSELITFYELNGNKEAADRLRAVSH